MGCRNGNPAKAGRGRAFVVFALLSSILGLLSDLQAASSELQSRQSASASLHISVNVIPIVSAASIAPAKRQSGAIIYTLESAPLDQKYELRILPRSPDLPGGTQHPAILKTLVVVAQ